MNWTSICWKGQADLTDPFNVSKLLQLNLAFSPHRLLQETTTLEGLRFKILHQKNDGLLHMNIMNCPLVPNFWAIPQKKTLWSLLFDSLFQASILSFGHVSFLHRVPQVAMKWPTWNVCSTTNQILGLQESHTFSSACFFCTKIDSH